MTRFNQLAAVGAALLSLALVGYAIYELVLYPAAGFPTEDFSVIVRGVDTLRVGHWLKFGYAIGIAMVVTGLQPRLRERAPVWAGLAAIAGAVAVALFIASGHLGLGILSVAQDTFATKPDEAITTILMRTVTISLFEAATFASGWYLLLISVAGIRAAVLPRLLSWVGVVIGALHIVNILLPDGLLLVAPLATIGWAGWLAVVVWSSETGGAVSARKT